jgi:hypothetical protein
MFCSRCGSPLEPNSVACSHCGRRIGDPTGAVAASRLESHLRTLAILWIVLSGLFLIPAFILMIFGQTAHFIFRGQDTMPAIFPLLVFIASGSLILIAGGGICVGLGLLQRRPWARVAAIILGCFSLFHPPFGTALGIYTLWVLLADEHGNEYRYLSQAN